MRQKSKKGSSGASRRAKKTRRWTVRRTSQASRGTARRAASRGQALGRKPEQGAVPGMTAKKTTQRQGFKTNEFIVYPAHGVGQIVAIEEQEVAGAKLELFVINFVKDKMTLRVPTAKIVSVGMRKLAEGAAGQARARDAQGPRPHQAHHVVAPRAGIRSQDQFRRHRRHRRGGARPVPVRHPARAVLLRAAALRSRARPAVARDRGGAARSPRPRRSRKSRRRSPRARAAVRSRRKASWSRKRRRNSFALSSTNSKARSQDRAFCFCSACHVCGIAALREGCPLRQARSATLT